MTTQPVTLYRHLLESSIGMYKSVFQTNMFYLDVNRQFNSLSGIMTSKLVIRESESPPPAASTILISRMTCSSVIIPYLSIMTYTYEGYAPLNGSIHFVF